MHCLPSGRWFNRPARSLYGITRIPSLPHDWNTATPHPTTARHITVIVRDNFYKLDVFSPDGTAVGPAEIEKLLGEIVADARNGDGVAVGVLTSDERDIWTKVSDTEASVL